MKTEPENGMKSSVNQNSYANNLAINIRKMLSHTKFIYLFSFTKYITWSDFILDEKLHEIPYFILFQTSQSMIQKLSKNW